MTTGGNWWRAYEIGSIGRSYALRHPAAISRDNACRRDAAHQAVSVTPPTLGADDLQPVAADPMGARGRAPARQRTPTPDGGDRRVRVDDDDRDRVGSEHRRAWHEGT